MVSNDGRALLLNFSAAFLWSHSDSIVRRWEEFQRYIQCEKHTLELFLFRLQKVRLSASSFCVTSDSCSLQLRRHQFMILTKARSEEEAYGSRVSDWADVDCALVN